LFREDVSNNDVTDVIERKRDKKIRGTSSLTLMSQDVRELLHELRKHRTFRSFNYLGEFE